jgi:hypothetical protein
VTSMFSLEMAKTGALTLKDNMEQLISKSVSFAQKIFEGFLLNCLKSFPQFKQNFWNFSCSILHHGHGGVSFLPMMTLALSSFSDAMSVANIPINVRIKPAAEWKISMATSSPKMYAAETMAVMRRMFKASNMKNPRVKIPTFPMVEVCTMANRKTANMRKAVSV